MYQVIISWISGALLPIVALGMTALVAQRLKMIGDEDDKLDVVKPDIKPDVVEKFLSHKFLAEDNDKIENEVKKRMAEIPIETLVQKYNDLQKSAKDKEEIETDDLDDEVKSLTPNNEIEEKKVEEQFEKELIIEPPKKKAGQPKTVTVPKKEQELLQNEEVKVSEEKKHRVSNPLTKKGNKPELIKDIEQINPASKGKELIESLKNDAKPIEDSIPIEQPTVIETPSPEPLKDFTDSVEVVDVKAVPIKKK
jgi:hypothetical protein